MVFKSYFLPLVSIVLFLFGTFSGSAQHQIDDFSLLFKTEERLYQPNIENYIDGDLPSIEEMV